MRRSRTSIEGVRDRALDREARPVSRTTENSTRTSPTLWRRCWPARSQLLQALRLRPRQRTQRLSSNKRNEQDGRLEQHSASKARLLFRDGPVAHCGPSNRHSVPLLVQPWSFTGVHDLPDLSSVRHQFLQLHIFPECRTRSSAGRITPPSSTIRHSNGGVQLISLHRHHVPIQWRLASSRRQC